MSATPLSGKHRHKYNSHDPLQRFGFTSAFRHAIEQEERRRECTAESQRDTESRPTHTNSHVRCGNVVRSTVARGISGVPVTTNKQAPTWVVALCNRNGNRNPIMCKRELYKYHGRGIRWHVKNQLSSQGKLSCRNARLLHQLPLRCLLYSLPALHLAPET